MKYQEDNIMIEDDNYARFHKENYSKRPCSAEDDDLQPQDVFQGSNRSLNTCSSHESTEDKLIRQFNSSVGMHSLERSVSSFYLEMCNNDLRAAVDFFKEQNNATAKPYLTPSSPPVARKSTGSQPMPHKRMHSFDDVYIQPRSQHKFGRIKSFDAAEAASVTSPNGVQMPSFSSYSAPKPVPRKSGGGTPAPVRFSHRRATQCVVQLPNRRDTPWRRSKSEYYLRDAMPQQQQALTSSSAHCRLTTSPTTRIRRSFSPTRGVIRSRSDSKVHHRHQRQSSMKNRRNLDYSEAPSVTSAQAGYRLSTSTPTSPRRDNRDYRGLYRQHSPQRSSWEPPTAKTAHYNPAA